MTEDLRIHDCSRPCSGGSGILLVSEKVVHNYTDNPVWINGIGQKTNSAGFTKSKNFFTLESTIDAAKNAFSFAKKIPNDVDVAEVHDAFTVCELMAIEDIGLISKNKSSEYESDCNGQVKTDIQLWLSSLQ